MLAITDVPIVNIHVMMVEWFLVNICLFTFNFAEYCQCGKNIFLFKIEQKNDSDESVTLIEIEIKNLFI